MVCILIMQEQLLGFEQYEVQYPNNAGAIVKIKAFQKIVNQIIFYFSYWTTFYDLITASIFLSLRLLVVAQCQNHTFS